MSEPQLSNPIPQSQDPASSPTEPPGGSITPDPLLERGSFIDPERNDSGAESPQYQQYEHVGNLEFGPGVVIAAEPISMFLPEEGSVEAAPRSVRRRSPEEMSKRPSWLPEDWRIDLKVRSSGATAGLIDRYYVEPTGQRRFRSKNEVLHFLETGNKLKRKPTSETDTRPSGSPANQKQKKSSTKGKKSEALNSDIKHPPHVLNGVQADNVRQL